MISAFGVDHGEISKGIPSALRASVRPGYKGKGPATKYGQDRAIAHFYGRSASEEHGRAAKFAAQGRKPKKIKRAREDAQITQAFGQEFRGSARRTLKKKTKKMGPGYLP